MNRIPKPTWVCANKQTEGYANMDVQKTNLRRANTPDVQEPDHTSLKFPDGRFRLPAFAQGTRSDSTEVMRTRPVLVGGEV